MALLVLLILLSSCSATLNPDKFTNGENSPTPSPELTVSTTGLFNTEHESIMNVNINIERGSLIYKLDRRSLIAQTIVYLKIINEKNDTVVVDEKYDVKIVKPLTSDINALGTQKLNKQFKLPAGEYTVQVSAVDESTGEQSLVTTTSKVQNPNKQTPFLTDIQLLCYNPKSGIYETVTNYGLEAKYDTLRFIVQVSVPANLDEPLQMTSNLIEFASDTLPARPIGNANYSESSLHYKGVNYHRKEKIQTINRKLLPDDKNVTVIFNFPMVDRGNYRFNVELKKSSGGDKKQIDFGIRSEHFPVLTTAWEKTKPLIYLMDDDEYKELMLIKNVDSLKNAIEQFWHHHIQPRAKAREVMQQYYSRVVVANKEFSNFKEGWKTDEGMIFILFGNPWIIDKDLKKKTWYYSYNRLDHSKSFTFERVKVFSESYPFKNYVLKRKFDYNNVLYQQKQLWLSGAILDIQI